MPLHTLIASIAKRDGRLWSVLGCMGADGQPQIQLQLYSAMIDHGLDIQEAIELPRFMSGRFGLGEARDTLHLEGRFSDEAVRELAQRGHIINRLRAWNEMAGHAHGITIDPQSVMLAGGADPRSDGAAVGY
jgi:gamma-glutamyltranspeptidase/glutathione hydrolase